MSLAQTNTKIHASVSKVKKLSLFVQILNQPSIHLLDNFISLRIRGQNRNGSKGCVRDLCRNDLPKNIGKSGSLACPFKYIGSVATYIYSIMARIKLCKSPKARQINPRIAWVIYSPKVEDCICTTFSQYLGLARVRIKYIFLHDFAAYFYLRQKQVFVQNK